MTVTESQLPVDLICDHLDSLIAEFIADFHTYQQNDESEVSELVERIVLLEDEALSRICSLIKAAEELQRHISEIRSVLNEKDRRLESLHIESRTDPLTKLLNRRAFDEELVRQSEQARNNSQPVALAMLDIDRFKLINDTYGHAAGDKVLRGVANMLNTALRETDVVARIGGEEFAVILPNTNLLDACRAAERIRTVIGATSVQHASEQLGITVSIGITASENAANALAAAQQADSALYKAKQAGRNCIFVFKDQAFQPVSHNNANEYKNQRRRYMRFLAASFQIRVRDLEGAWHAADVLDESIDGIGVIVRENHEVVLRHHEHVVVDYCGELRSAELMNFSRNDENVRLGLQWIDRPWHLDGDTFVDCDEPE